MEITRAVPLIEFPLSPELKSFDYINALEFENDKIREWVVKKCQKRLKRKKFRQMNHWATALFKDQLGNDALESVVVKWVSAKIGYGIFSTKDLTQFTYIGEYTGIVRKRKRRKDLFNDYIFGYITGDKSTPFIIDAKDKGNFIRFINHSDHPNLTSRWLIYDDVTHIILFANRFISKGEQLTYDYGPLYWRSRSAPKAL